MSYKDGIPDTGFNARDREWVKKVAEESGGGGGLPEVTAADAGKVLQVSGEGEWEAGENVFIVTVSYEYDETDNYYTNVTSDKTFSEILTAIKAGKVVYCYDSHNNQNLPLLYWSESPSDSHITFQEHETAIVPDSTTVNHQNYKVTFNYSNDSWGMSVEMYLYNSQASNITNISGSFPED